MISMTDRAAERIREVTHKREGDYVGLRVGLQDGGCSGYAYQLEFEASPEDDDLVFEHEGAKVFVHPLHLPFLQGSMLVWNDTELVSGFALENPNVKRVCGCGESFDV
ncbi:MAG: iron-sulfur cluster assembly accessory protein [Myxococcota bacterium]